MIENINIISEQGRRLREILLGAASIQRMQKRPVPQIVVDWLVDFGRSEPEENGTSK